MKYKTNVEPRHYYNLLVIRKDNEDDSFNILGTLRFDNDAIGNKSLEHWKSVIESMDIKEELE